MSQNIIEIQGVSKVYGDNTVLDNLSLNIRKNEFLTLLGPSGCGKTTTLKIIAGFETADSGKVVFAGNDISDVRHAVQLALELTEKYAGELYISESGHLEFAYSASAGPALQKAFHAEPGEAFGFMAGSPAAIGLVMADTAMKASSVKITSYMTPDMGTAHSNEVILSLSGDASAVKEAVLNARQIGLELLIAMGSYPEIPGTPYL